jgi:hypothetical protein
LVIRLSGLFQETTMPKSLFNEDEPEPSTLMDDPYLSSLLFTPLQFSEAQESSPSSSTTLSTPPHSSEAQG